LIGFAILGSFVDRPANIGFTTAAGASLPSVSNEAVGIGEPAPVLHEAPEIVEHAAVSYEGPKTGEPAVSNEAEHIAQGEMESAEARTFVPSTEKAKTPTRRPLTSEEKAAVLRGLRELARGR
jgi:hypothetical protein